MHLLNILRHIPIFAGYVTTTKIMFILVVEDDAVPDLQQNVDAEIKSLLVSQGKHCKFTLLVVNFILSCA
jgi:hypothetical protein